MAELCLAKKLMLRLKRSDHREHGAQVASVWQSADAAWNDCVYRRGLVALYIDGGHFADALAKPFRRFLVKALEGIRDLRP